MSYTADDINRLIAAPSEDERLAFDRCGGDYTAEREQLLADVTMDELVESIQRREQER